MPPAALPLMHATVAFAPVCAASGRARSNAESKSPRRPRTQRLNLRDPAALDAELRRFSAAMFEDPNVLPRQEDLMRARRGDLRYAIERYHGGFRSLRRVSSQRRRPVAAANPRFDVLASEIREFIETHIAPLDPAHAALARTLFPTHHALRSAGRADLVRAVRAAGGSRAVAARMGLRLHYHASTDYSGESARFHAEIRRFIAARPTLKSGGLFPTAAELHAEGRLDIIAGIRAHGGAKSVANEMQLKLQRGRRRDPEGLRRELKAIGGDAIPADASLVGAGRVDVLHAIRGMGGRERAAEILGVDGGEELAKTFFDEGFFQLEVCTDETVLVHNEGNKVRQDLQKAPAEERGGGGGALLPKAGGRRREKHYFSSFERLQQELMCFIFDDGVAGVMPTAQELIRAGRRDLVRAMQLHGGQKVVAARLGLIMHSMGRKKILQRVAETVAV